MRLRHIEVFHAVYLHGSVSAAARALNVSQPSVSKVLRHAEDQLGFALFTLVRGRLLPTDEAHALFREATDVVGRLTTFQQTARNLRAAAGGHLRLGVVPALGFSIVPQAVTRFRARHPGVTFSIQMQHHDRLVAALYARELDLVLAHDLPPHPRFEKAELTRAELVIISPAGALGVVGGRRPLADLDGKDWVGVSASGPLGETIEAAIERAGVSLNETVAVQTYYVAAAFVRLEAGSCIVDEFTARAMACPEMDMHRLEPPLRFSVEATWLEDRPPSAMATRLLDELRQVLAEQRKS